MPRLGRRLGLPAALVVAIALTGASAAPAAIQCPAQDLRPTRANVAAVRGATMCLINLERRHAGQKTLRSSRQLRTAAKRYSRAMVRGHFFRHANPTGPTLVSRLLQRHPLLAENLGWGLGDGASAGAMVHAWMQSPSHRDVILDPSYRHIGIGIVVGAPQAGMGLPAATYTTYFGQRAAR